MTKKWTEWKWRSLQLRKRSYCILVFILKHLNVWLTQCLKSLLMWICFVSVQKKKFPRILFFHDARLLWEIGHRRYVVWEFQGTSKAAVFCLYWKVCAGCEGLLQLTHDVVIYVLAHVVVLGSRDHQRSSISSRISHFNFLNLGPASWGRAPCCPEGYFHWSSGLGGNERFIPV